MTRQRRSNYEDHHLADKPISHVQYALKDAHEAREIWDKIVRENEHGLTPRQQTESSDYRTYAKYADQVHDYLQILKDKQEGLLPSPSDRDYNAKQFPAKSWGMNKASSKRKADAAPARSQHRPDSVDEDGYISDRTLARISDADRKRKYALDPKLDVMYHGRENERSVNARKKERRIDNDRANRPFPFAVWPNTD